MSKTERARAQISVLGVISLLVISTLMIWKPSEVASGKAAMLASPPGIDISEMEIFAPQTGSRVVVKTNVAAFPNALAGTTEVMIRDLNTGAESAWYDWSNAKPLWMKFSGGGYGDLIEVAARNGTVEATAVIGTVPAPADVAPPDLDESAFTGSGTSTFQVSWTTQSIFDGSFPGTASLSIVGETTISTTTISGNSIGSNASGGSLSVSVASPALGKRAVLTIEDDYGNRTDLEFIVGQDSIADAGWTT